MALRAAKVSPNLKFAKAKFEESKHKRDATGKFADKPGVGNDAPAKALKLKVPAGSTGKISGITASDKIEIVTSSKRFTNGMTIQQYIDKVNGDVEKALRRIAREMKEGKIKIQDAKVTALPTSKTASPVTAPTPKQVDALVAKAQATPPKEIVVSTPKPVDDFPAIQLKKVGDQMGSNPGGVFESENGGQKYYVKFYANSNQARTESLSGALYRLGGAGTMQPKLAMVNGKPAVLSPYRTDVEKFNSESKLLGTAVNKNDAEDLADIYHNAVLTKNWDVVGDGFDNIVRDKKTLRLLQVDTGGSFKFRAQGGPKDYGPDAKELDSLMQTNLPSGKIFAAAMAAHPQAFKNSAARLAKMDMAKAEAAFKASGLKDSGELFENYKMRHAAILKRADDIAISDAEKALAKQWGSNWKSKEAAWQKMQAAGENIGAIPAAGQKIVGGHLGKDGLPKPLVKDLKDDVKLHVTVDKNPYPDGSDAWIKYNAIAYSSDTTSGAGGPSLAKYMTTKALTIEGKQAALQQMVDDGVVTLVSPARAAALQAKKIAENVKKQSAGLKVYETGDKRWAAAAGVKTSALPPAIQTDGAALKETLNPIRDNLGVNFYASTEKASVKYYTGSGYTSLNSNLRTQAALSPNQAKHAKRLDQLISGSTVQNDTILYRGIGTSSADKFEGINFNDIPPPSDFTDRGFSSMSLNPSRAIGFGGYETGAASVKTLFRVRVPKGAKGIYVSRPSFNKDTAAMDEAEVIFQRNSRYRYVSHGYEATIGGQRKVIEVELVREDGSQY